ncbi:MAG: dienelactone hydrolase family protein [Bacteroidales bacterium]|nr:dienelactone hydrolase family protein [Bacteroidales bacterium]
MATLPSRRKFIKAVSLTVISLSITSRGSIIQNVKADELQPLLVDSKGRPIKSLSGWKNQRKVIQKRWLNYLGALEPNPSPPELIVLKEDRPRGLVRQLVEYESEPGIMVKGYLIKPQNISEPLPGVVAMHSTSDKQMVYIAGVEEGRIVAFGYKLAQQGFVVFCPLCFLWHDKGERNYEQQVERFQKRHPNSKGMAKMLFDAQRAVDVLVNLEEVDSERIGAMGHSLGAKEVLYLAAFDERVIVTVSNEGGIGITFSNWDAVWYLGKEIHDFEHQHHEVLSLVAPKPFLLIGGDSADGEKSRPYIEAVLPVYDLYGNKRQNIELFNHGQGHSVTPGAEKLTYDWIKKYL